ncbi:MAG TPA: hypothetical protein DGX96_12810 [Lachnospiraceae bacterium]|nr:hypothetical protein [Lachnospiraceae bacterium]
MTGTARIETKRLVLRPHVMEDAEYLYRHFGTDERMYAYSGWNPYATERKARETVRHFIESYKAPSFFGWAIEAGQGIIGTIGAYDYDAEKSSVEVGISIAPEFWGKGYATEALQAVITYLTRDNGIRTVKAWCASDNIGSKRAMEKCGMQQTGIDHGALKIGDHTFDRLNYEYTTR